MNFHVNTWGTTRFLDRAPASSSTTEIASASTTSPRSSSTTEIPKIASASTMSALRSTPTLSTPSTAAPPDKFCIGCGVFHVASIFGSEESSGGESSCSNAHSTAQSQPIQVFMVDASTRSPGAGTSREEPTFPMEVTMQDKVTTLTITREMGVQAMKHVQDCTFPPA